MLGLALDPQRSTTGRPSSTCCTPTTRTPNSTQVPRWRDSCPNAARRARPTAASSPAGSRAWHRRRRAVLIEDFVPAVPEPLGRLRSPSAPTARSTSAPATARASTSPTTARTATRATRAATRRPASAARRPRPTAEGGALRSQDMRTTGDPASLDGAILRVNPDTGAALPDNPNAGSPDAEHASHRRLRPAQPVPDHRSGPGRARSGRATSAGTRGRRSTASRRRRRERRATSAGPATRAPAGGLVRQPEPQPVREPVQRRAPSRACRRRTTRTTTVAAW